ncbi:hypothetical protein IEQ34_001219 [Dendrobium chrysotoxum]|uniref:Uncharacterized protein n=1 Tax=Dendrobium chrysotoxum TaxID=161865 RepID=A0AAV7HL25_DENCH|nr:hypothetical protein IEQ34_001219 [Dendrobium chrysotoxum]
MQCEIYDCCLHYKLKKQSKCSACSPSSSPPSFYNRFPVPLARRLSANPCGISHHQRMGAGFAIHIITMFIASFTKRHRLSVAKANGVAESGATVDFTIFVLASPTIPACGDRRRAPEGRNSLVTSQRRGRQRGIALAKGWTLNKLNKSYLECYYALSGHLQPKNKIFFRFKIQYKTIIHFIIRFCLRLKGRLVSPWVDRLLEADVEPSCQMLKFD